MCNLANQSSFKNKQEILDDLIKFGVSLEVAEFCLKEKKKATVESIKGQDKIHRRDLLECFKNRSEKEKQAVLAAYKIAFDQHLFKPKNPENAFRKGGGLYIGHPVAVALLIQQQKPELPIDVALVGLLHDVLEDTEIEPEDLFNKILPFLSSPDNLESFKTMLDAVTKVEDPVAEIAERETYQKFANLAKISPPAVFVKMADRLHNMTTMTKMHVDSQRKICRVNRDYLLPIFKQHGEDYFYKKILELTTSTEKRLSINNTSKKEDSQLTV